MKKLFTLLSLLALLSLSTNVFAQGSTGTTPAPGAKHQYSVTDNGNTYTWSVTKGNLTTPADADAVLSSTSGATIDITWATSVTVGDWYYVHVIEADGACTNEKVLPVQITASPFYLVIAASSPTQCYDDPVEVSLDGTSPQYNHGKATIVYTVTPSGLSDSYSGYTFDLSIAFNQSNVAGTPTVTSGNGSISGGTVTVSDNSAVTISFETTNSNINNNTTDADGTAANITATATISQGVAANGVSDNGTGAKDDTTAVSRPATTTISTN